MKKYLLCLLFAPAAMSAMDPFDQMDEFDQMDRIDRRYITESFDTVENFQNKLTGIMKNHKGSAIINPLTDYIIELEEYIADSENQPEKIKLQDFVKKARGIRGPELVRPERMRDLEQCRANLGAPPRALRRTLFGGVEAAVPVEVEAAPMEVEAAPMEVDQEDLTSDMSELSIH